MAGNLVRFVDREGRVREYERDVYGRVTQETWIVGGTTVNEIEYTYDVAGRLTSIADTLGLDANSYSYVYDALDRVTSTTSVFAGGPTVELADAYDRLDGLRSSSTATVGSTVEEYDSLAVLQK